MEGYTKYTFYLFPVFCVMFHVFGGSLGLDLCDRTPIHTTEPQKEGDGGFALTVLGLHRNGRYTPGETYTVVLNRTTPQKFTTKGHLTDEPQLLGLMLVAINASTHNETATVGKFLISPADRVKAAEECNHTVITHYYLFPKRKGVSMKWQAPLDKNLCVELRATVITGSTEWHKDEGGLTTKMCADDPLAGPQGDATGIVNDSPGCCACGHARYEMTFEGLWSQQTHPKDFPTGRDAVQLHWSSIIGASHSDNYKIWEYGGYSSPGVRQVCQFGFSNTLEADMRQNSRDIHTVIKTTPMWHNILDTRTATYTVNREAHLLSLLTMIGPSPDWCVGVSEMNMCQENCTWAEQFDIDLFPWDAGTDDGRKYVERRKIPTVHQQRIQRITNTNPNDQDSPFYGIHPVKPMAKLTLRKIRDVCDGTDGSSEDTGGSPSTQELIDEMKKNMMENKKLQMMKCATTKWSSWTECSNNCGFGMKQRSRGLLNQDIHPSMCSQVEFMEKVECQGDCTGETQKKVGREKLAENFEVRHTVEIDLQDPCAVTPWSDWSPCSAKVCGLGVRERWRMFLRKTAQFLNCGVAIMEKDVCHGIIPDCRKAFMMKNFTAICNLSPDPGPCRGDFPRWYYSDTIKKCLPLRYGGCRGNDNNFETSEDCTQQCVDYMANLSPDGHVPSTGSEETLSAMERKKLMMQKQLMMEKQRMMKQGQTGTQVEQTNETGNEKLMAKKKRQMMRQARKLERSKKKRRKHNKHKSKPRSETQSGEPVIDCMVTPWGEYSTCSVTCGKGYMTKVRMIKVQAQNGGRKCPRKLERRKKCKMPKCES